MLRLYTYFLSSAAHRVRIALNLKGLDYEPVFVHLGRGEQRADSFLERNPQGFVPLLEDGAVRVFQSLAIIEYLDERFPDPPLLPPDPAGRARVRALAQICACEMHPLNNLRVRQYLEHRLGLDEAARMAWCQHWMVEGFAPLERRLLEPETGRFCHGDSPCLADICLAAQAVSAARWGTDMAPYPTVRRIFEACQALEPFQQALPARQPDAE